MPEHAQTSHSRQRWGHLPNCMSELQGKIVLWNCMGPSGTWDTMVRAAAENSRPIESAHGGELMLNLYPHSHPQNRVHLKSWTQLFVDLFCLARNKCKVILFAIACLHDGSFDPPLVALCALEALSFWVQNCFYPPLCFGFMMSLCRNKWLVCLLVYSWNHTIILVLTKWHEKRKKTQACMHHLVGRVLATAK